ncbi:DUF4395 domain-containing protein [Catenuloplanes atrovinosus]|uniref:DUF4395 domain-containing protein n=1 Tax=Catenuloplanes atrovinosus TaxID=137266 RepID=A0AAE3YRA6_9ACTN|nr:DUF4395 domain-containing protein [Catenuloplanes atrovinosus]MDR7276321.1 hypothetical protein [Catenuloplanes atrovinosus]
MNGIDPRGPRFGAALTSVVLVVVLVTGSGWLALAQAVVFAITALDLRLGPYALLYRALVAPRLGPPAELEAPEPPRFAQLVGMVFTVAATIGYLAGAPVAGAVFAGAALFAAFLNAAFGFCLGCRMYLVIRRLAPR